MVSKARSPRPARGPRWSSALGLRLLACITAVTVARAYSNNGGPICSYTTAALTASVHGAGTGAAGGFSATAGAAGAYTIALTGFTSYEGIVMWVRDAGGKNLGSWTVPTGGFQLKGDCGGSASGTLQHSNKAAKSATSFTWTGDATIASGTQLTVEAVIVQTLTNWKTVPGYTFAYGGSGAAAPSSAAPGAASGTANAATTPAAGASVSALPAATTSAAPASQAAGTGTLFGLSSPLIIAISIGAASVVLVIGGIIFARSRKRRARSFSMDGTAGAGEARRALRASFGETAPAGRREMAQQSPSGSPKGVYTAAALETAVAPSGRSSRASKGKHRTESSAGTTPSRTLAGSAQAQYAAVPEAPQLAPGGPGWSQVVRSGTPPADADGH